MKFSFLILLLGAAGCSNSTTTTNGPYAPILLTNSTFDVSGNPSLNGWTYGKSDIDSQAQFEHDAPPSFAAQWSIALEPGWIPSTTFVTRSFTGLTSGIYKLSLWSKVSPAPGVGHFGIAVGKIPYFLGGTEVMDSVWTQHVLLDTLTLKFSDTVSIYLTGGSSEIAAWKVLYNNISFQKLP